MYASWREGEDKHGGRGRERERERDERDVSPIEVPPHKVVDLLFSFGMEILKLVHCTAR